MIEVVPSELSNAFAAFRRDRRPDDNLTDLEPTGWPRGAAAPGCPVTATVGPRCGRPIRRDVLEHGYDPGLGSFVRSYDATELEASLLVLPHVRFLPYDDPRIVGTVPRSSAT